MQPSPRNRVALPPFSKRIPFTGHLDKWRWFLLIGGTLVPACLLALLSFRSATRQLSVQRQTRLNALASAAGRTLYDRLILFEADLRKLSPGLLACGRSGGTRGCGEALLYAVDGVARISDRGPASLLAGDSHLLEELGAGDFPALAPGQSALLTRATSGGRQRLYLVHRPEAGGGGWQELVARISDGYLWASTDEAGLPPGVELSLWSSAAGVLFGPLDRGLARSPEIARSLGATPQGSLRWRDGGAVVHATWWSLPETHRFRLPSWRIVLSEPADQGVAPIAAFAWGFPVLLVSAVLLFLALRMSRSRSDGPPAGELGRSRLRQEETSKALEEMSSRLAHQFQVLKTAAEIDRAVLSSVDTASIVQTVLDRLPEMCPCDGLSVTLLEPGEPDSAESWLSLGTGGGTTPVKTVLGATDLRQAREHPEWFVAGEHGAELPAYLRHFRRAGGTAVVEGFPLQYGGAVLGVLAFRRGAKQSSEESRVQVRLLADQMGVALSNARMIEQVRFLAFYDSLTRLPNRVLYKERLAQALVRAERRRTLVAVCYLDLDHFSRFNDTLGHDLGDQLLREIAARLIASSRTGDSLARFGMEERMVEVARLGGDEFTVVLQDISDPQDAVRVARRLLETFRQPIRLGSQEVFVTASIGIAIYPFDGTDLEDLVKNADVAMYHAKQRGRNTYQLYSASMNAEAIARLELEQQLRKAVEAREFTIWYQPIVDLETLQPAGAEALVRWTHPERGLVSPGEFIALCEECGLIVPLGEWILRTVCLQARRWELAGFGPIRMSVNLSARQLRHDGIVEMVRGILLETGMHPRSLVLELTESMLMEPRGVTGRTIRELADLGVSLAIDDFGTGYSSLSYLKNFPVTTLKIDRSFIADVTTNPDDSAITTAIIALAKALDLDVVAEGVETEEQAAFLRERGCQKIQGFLIGRPIPPPEFEAYLRGAHSMLVGGAPTG